ncbi:MAG: hypothetical protein ACK5WZ_11005 [Pseudobdellovibrionaceae bacterium]
MKQPTTKNVTDDGKRHNRPYCETTNEIYDDKGKTWSKQLFEREYKNEYYLKNGSQKGPDLEIHSAETNSEVNHGLIEVEVKESWKSSSSFRYNTVHVPHRKRRTFKNNPNLLYLLQWNYNGTACLWIHRDVILTCEVIEKTVHNNSEPEWFLEIPVNKCEIQTTTNNESDGI